MDGPKVGARRGTEEVLVDASNDRSEPKVGAMKGTEEALVDASKDRSEPSSTRRDCCTPLVARRCTPLVSRSVTASSSSVDGSEEEEYFQVSLSEQEQEQDKPMGESFSVELVEDRSASLESDPIGSPCPSYTGPNSDMQMVPRRAFEGPNLEESVPAEVGNDDTELQNLQQERLALCRIRRFCSSILKKLAPPLLREVEGSSGLRADAQPFTPRRLTRSTALEA
jgi:hypothetical protein